METTAAVVVVVAVALAAVPPKTNEQPRLNAPLLLSRHNPLLHGLLLHNLLRLTHNLLRLTVILTDPTPRTYRLTLMTMTVLE